MEQFPVVNCFQFSNFREDSQEILKGKIKANVVNCFQFSNFREDSQARENGSSISICCELLSVL